MDNKCVIFLPGAQAYDKEFGIDFELVESLKRFLTEQGIKVNAELLQEETTFGRQEKANTMIESINQEGQRLRCIIYMLK